MECGYWVSMQMHSLTPSGDCGSPIRCELFGAGRSHDVAHQRLMSVGYKKHINFGSDSN